MEAGPVKGGILGNDCGLGKTFTTFDLIAMMAAKCVRFAKEGKKFDVRPTLIVVPPSLIGSWYEEWHKYWKKITDKAFCPSLF
ncbi:hypothetical protein LTR84_008184 [Exophiala bonariae]|uniref:SNF2 N-terminal domain-containing protein n=1 Tax=Exophiala bonariae TaxID=1690606 RepID=A0AAV9MZJ2_9EURO|nr:hypothetical protein LTR84_008184 [Exophiala bonariae]